MKNNRLSDLDIQVIDGDRGVNYPKEKDFSEKGFCLFLNAKNVTDNGFKFDICQFISEEKDLILGNGKLNRLDIVLTTRGTVGNIAFYDENIPFEHIRINSGMVLLRNQDYNIDHKYLHHFLKSSFLKEQIERISFGSAQPQLTVKTINSIEISYPQQKETQRKIARILSTADAVIEKTQAAIVKYKAIKQGMLNDLFTHGIDPATGKLRPTYEDAPELYKESKLGWIPKEWSEGKFIDFADERISHSFTGGPFGSDLQTKHYTSSGVRIIQLQNIGDGVFNNGYKIYTSDEKANQLINCNIYHGEIIISKMADPIARACIIPDTEKRYLMASDGIRLSIDKKKFNSRFVMETINHKRFRTIAELKATGSTRARIGLSELREIAVVYPCKKEQDAIGIKLDTVENKLQTEQNYLHKMQQIKAGLMADLLSGKKKVNVDEEPVN